MQRDISPDIFKMLLMASLSGPPFFHSGGCAKNSNYCIGKVHMCNR